MANYSDFIFSSLNNVGNVIGDNRARARQNYETDRSYARMLGLDDYQREQDVMANRRADRSLDLQERRVNEGPALPQSYQEHVIAQGDPSYRGYLDSRDRKGMSVTEKKAIFEAEDDAANLGGTIEALTRARGLTDKTFSGAGAGVRGWLGTRLPDAAVPDFVASPEGANATAEWQNIMSMEAIKNMSQTLKGVTTDFELRKFEAVLADPSAPADIRNKVIDRMIGLAQRKQKILAERAGGIRDQTYFQPQNGQVPTGPTGNLETIEGDIDPQSLIQQAQEAIAAGADPAAVRSRLQEMGIDLAQ